MAITAKPCDARVPATAKASVRLRVMPCWKITTGQPVAGLVLPDAAFGMVNTRGTFCVDPATGSGLAKVTLVEVGSSRPANGGM